MHLLDVRVLRVHLVNFGRVARVYLDRCAVLRGLVSISINALFERSPALKSGTAAREERHGWVSLTRH